MIPVGTAYPLGLDRNIIYHTQPWKNTHGMPKPLIGSAKRMLPLFHRFYQEARESGKTISSILRIYQTSRYRLLPPASPMNLDIIWIVTGSSPPCVESQRGPRPHRNPPKLMVPSVKDMPSYDPDAEISSLTLTIPSWCSSLSRAISHADLQAVTDHARKESAS